SLRCKSTAWKGENSHRSRRESTRTYRGLCGRFRFAPGVAHVEARSAKDALHAPPAAFEGRHRTVRTRQVPIRSEPDLAIISDLIQRAGVVRAEEPALRGMLAKSECGRCGIVQHVRREPLEFHKVFPLRTEPRHPDAAAR